jgi:hypothetical protein
MASLQDDKVLAVVEMGSVPGLVFFPAPVAAGLDSRGRVVYKLFFGI